MNPLFPGVHTVFGMRGTGKSRLARALLAPIPRLIVIDTLSEHASMGILCASPGDVQRVLKPGPTDWRIVTRPRSLEETDWIERVAAARPGTTLFIDEISLWYQGSSVPIGEGVWAMVRCGRHYGQSVVVVSQRPADVSKAITSQSTAWILPLADLRDREYIRALTGFDASALHVGVRDTSGRVVETDLAQWSSDGLRVGRFNLITGSIGLPAGPA